MVFWCEPKLWTGRQSDICWHVRQWSVYQSRRTQMCSKLRCEKHHQSWSNALLIKTLDSHSDLTSRVNFKVFFFYQGFYCFDHRRKREIKKLASSKEKESCGISFTEGYSVLLLTTVNPEGPSAHIKEAVQWTSRYDMSHIVPSVRDMGVQLKPH